MMMSRSLVVAAAAIRHASPRSG
eukprot:SAG31_NODE_32691_length_352_cov_2.019763_1_plen_22_part_10